MMNPAAKAVSGFFITDEATGERFDLFDGMTVGRTQGDQQFANNLRMSSKHARFSITKGEITIEDLGSRNGTFINGERIDPGKAFRLLPGDLIEMGDLTFGIGRHGGTPLMTPMPKAPEDTSTELLKQQASQVSMTAKLEPNLQIARPLPQHSPELQPKLEAEPGPQSDPELTPEMGSSYPAVAYLIASVLTGVFILQFAQGANTIHPSADDLLRLGAVFGPLLHEEWWRLLAANFVHAGTLHIAGNLVAFWHIGRLVSDRLGGLSLATIFLGSGVLTWISFSLLHPEHIGAGATGSVFGLYGALPIIAYRDRTAFSAQPKAPLFFATLIFIVLNLGISLRITEDIYWHLPAVLVGTLIAWLRTSNAYYEGRIPRILIAVAPAIVISAALAFTELSPPIPNRSLEIRELIEKITPLSKRLRTLQEQTTKRQSPREKISTALRVELIPQLDVIKTQIAALHAFGDNRDRAIRFLRDAAIRWREACEQQARGIETDDQRSILKSVELTNSGQNAVDEAIRALEMWREATRVGEGARP